MADNEVRMMMSVLPGAMTGFAALNSGLVSINNVFGSLTRSIDAQFGLIDTAIMTTGVVVTQLGIDAMNAFGNFEQGMKIVQMVSGQTSQEIDLLSQKANQFSVQYRVDIDQITEGLQTLGRAGLNSASEQAEVLENGLYTAKLEGRDLNSVLEELIQTTALLGGNLKSPEFGEQSGYVEDLMVATSMTAPITTHDVNETLKYSGGIAAAAGANIETEEGKAILEDYMGSIAAFAQKGVTGSIAGTALRAFFNKPATQDSSVTEALASIHLKPEYLWEDDEQTMKPVSEQIRIINDQMKELNVSTMDQLQIWSKIVGGKMGQQMMKLDAEDIKELTSDIRAADDASSLATNSMKTYEANVKALGESGALLQRNVGEKLVFFANPILEILNKVSSFANQDFMSWPIAIGILSFIGLAGKKAFGVISALKSEIATLYSGMKQGLSYFTQKQGVVRAGSNSLEQEAIDRYKAYFKAKDEYYGTSRGKESGEKGKTSKSVNEMTPQEFQKSLWKQSSQATVADLKKAGWTDTEIGLSGRMSVLKKDSFKIGMSDAEFANFLGRHHILTDAQQAEASKLLSTTSGARGPFNQLFMKDGEMRADIAEQIRRNEAAVKELGVTVQEEVPVIENNMRAHAEATTEINEESTKIEANTKEKQSAANKQVEVEKTKNAEILEENILQGPKLVENEMRKNAEVLEVVTVGSEEVVAQISTAVMQAKNVVGAINGKPTSSMMPGFYTGAGLNRGAFYGDTAVTTPLGGLSQGVLVGGIAAKADALAEAQANLLLKRILGDVGFPLTKDIYPDKPYYTPPFKSGSITGGGQPPIPEGYTYGPNKLLLLPEAEVTKHPPTAGSVGVGDLSRLVPNLWRSGVQVAAPRSGVENVNLGSGLEARLKAEEDAEKQTRKNLSNVKHGYDEAELNAHKQGLAIEEEILAARRQGAEAASVTKNQQNLSTEKDRQKFQDERNNSKLITSRKDIEDINRQSKSLYNANQRALSTEKDRQRFQEERNNSKLITSRQDIKQLQNASTEAVQSSLRVANAQKKLLEVQKAGGAIEYNRNQRLKELLPAADNEFYKSQKNSGWGTNQPLSYYNLSQSQLKDIAIAEYKDLNKTRQMNLSQFGFGASFMNRINKDRTGSFASFGAELIDKNNPAAGVRSATKGLSGLANKALNLSDAFGGPLMIAIMAVTTAIQLWQKAFQDYCEDLKEAGQQLEEAYSKFNSANDKLEETYRRGNPDATDEEIEQMMYDTYANINEDMANAWNNGSKEYFKKLNTEPEKGRDLVYDEEKDDGTTTDKEVETTEEEEYTQALKENTGALYAACAELNVALSNYTRKAMDSWWGADGWTGWVTDQFGGFADKITHSNTEGSTFSENGNEFMLTQSQADENYQGYTEMAGLMLEDFKDANGNWIKGLRTMMGKDVEMLANIIPKDSYNMLKGHAKFASSLGPQNNMKIQQSMKNDKKTWKNLAKELAKYDSKNRAGKDTKRNLSKINGMVSKINQTLGGGFQDVDIKQAAYIQQLQDMYEVTQQSIVPIMTQNAQTAASTLFQASNIGASVGGTGQNTGGTWETAGVIAGLVAILAKTAAGKAAYQTALEGSEELGAVDVNGDGQADQADVDITKLARESTDENDFYKKAMQYYDEYRMYDAAAKDGNPLAWAAKIGGQYSGKSTAAGSYIAQIAEATAKMTAWGYDAETANEEAKKFIKDSEGKRMSDIMNTIGKNYTQNDKFRQKIIDNYLASDDGDDDNGSGGGGGGNGGGDSGNKDNTGTKKERVDLVLCNKKEIPKLNVNLFKKPPSFTVLNKNFKLRDLKINTEDKPKAIMSSIKNAFIDVQKRSDPKIIQDEEAEYDPVAATDGNATPSGSAKTKTDSKTSSN